MHWRLLALPMLSTWQLWIGNVLVQWGTAMEGITEVCLGVRKDGENSNTDELVAPRELDNRRGVATMHAKLGMAAQKGKVRVWTRATLSYSLDVFGVRLPSSTNRRRARDIAMHHALPLLVQCNALVLDMDHVTCSATLPSSSQPCTNPQSPTAANRQRPPTANCQPLPIATNQ